MIRNQDVIILVGPTGTGKTRYSVELAIKENAEIINCDMSQIFSVGRIATGRIKEHEMMGVEHHLFGFLNDTVSISVYEMRCRIESKIEEILNKKKKVILVGGSCFCVYSLFFAPNSVYKELGYGLEGREVNVFNNKNFFDNNVNGKIILYPRYKYNIIFYDIFIERKDFWMLGLRERIKLFFEEGLIQEVMNMEAKWKDFLIRKGIIGYSELIPYILQNNFILNENEDEIIKIKDLIFFRTCQYGKKQRTFIKKMKRDFLLNEVEFNEYYI